MTILYYESTDRLAIADEDFFPDDEENIEPLHSEEEALPIDEWKTYYVKVYGEKDILFLDSGKSFVKPLHGRVFEVNFRNFVGRTRIGNVNLQVKNKKISDALYDSMLGYIAEKYADLIFSFNTPVGLEYRKDSPGQDILYLQYLFLKKYLVDSKPDLDEVTGLILSRPHRKMVSETRRCSIDEIDHLDAGLLLSLFSDPGRMLKLGKDHPLISSSAARAVYERTGEYYFPTEAEKIQKYHSFDTNENRFIKHFLEEILKKLKSIETALGSQPGTWLNPEIAKNIRNLKQKTLYFLSNPIWNDVGQMTFVPGHSTVLQRREGYRHLFRLHALLNLVTRYQFTMKDFQNLIEIKDVPTLFEYWSFFLVKDVLDMKLKTKGFEIIVSSSEKERVVQQGIRITYEGGISLLYNAGYGGSTGLSLNGNSTETYDYKTSESYSHTLRPDVVIEKDGGKKLILDAKYKGKDASGFYGEEEGGTIVGYRHEDLDKMHTYRDAIKDVFGAFALYPGEKTNIFPPHSAESPLQGVGAVALKPIAGNKAKPRHMDNLKKIIDAFLETA
jgi:predicted component of viral defense system (DUF524 family)